MTENSRTYALVNLGCKVNRVESDGFEAQLHQAGFRPVAEAADIVVVNTCTVTGEAEKKTRKAVRQALKANPDARILVTGCAAAIAPEIFQAMDNRIEVVPKAEVDAHLRHISSSRPSASPLTSSRPSEASGEIFATPEALSESGKISPLRPLASGRDDEMIRHPERSEGSSLDFSRTRRGVKVQDGCDHACTYCIVHVARGKSSSRPAPDVVADALALARAGVGEVVLSGINLGSYQWQGLRLHDLLGQLLEATEGLPVRFRISSVEPMDVSDELIALLAQTNGRICRHLHLPLQSGSSKVLSEMDRPYSAEQFVELVDRLYAACPTLSLSTDIIAGFPGETEGEFQETLDVARRCRFSKIHAFPYSRREGTPAADRTDQVPPEEKANRARQLRQLASDLRHQEYARRVGTEEWAVVEEPGRACTESYYEIKVPQDQIPGALIKATLPEGFIA
ncbi:MAG: tRNA (N(6)-L-threonylcarbamoyladenosine(37)-C(2))-methylthiotransferase MtaB [Eggerthellaceae bacterium]|nr:tRNA (N(6)-L-threonylcarbamoyladenosine(37)-C(2))-methylthiotransferase MtaB [Eggerthellaceae bacterium]